MESPGKASSWTLPIARGRLHRGVCHPDTRTRDTVRMAVVAPARLRASVAIPEIGILFIELVIGRNRFRADVWIHGVHACDADGMHRNVGVIFWQVRVKSIRDAVTIHKARIPVHADSVLSQNPARPNVAPIGVPHRSEE